MSDPLGIMPLARELGDILRCEEVPPLRVIREPQRLTCGRWSPEAWAEIEQIYATPDPFEQEL